MPRGNLFIISAPSGAGKTSLVKALLAATTDLVVSVSHTTRMRRQGEKHGQDYFFIDLAEFQAMLTAGAFLEHAQVFDNHYGTSRQNVEANLAAGKDVLLEIDWQGARQVRAAILDSITIFILPPSRQSLLQRLQSRGQDSEAVIMRRMQAARSEISHYGEADYLIVNDQFETALTELTAIITATRLGRQRQVMKHSRLLAELLANN